MAYIYIMDRQGMNQSKIARALNDKGVQTFSGKGKWFQFTIRNTLENLKGKERLPEGIEANVKELLKRTPS